MHVCVGGGCMRVCVCVYVCVTRLQDLARGRREAGFSAAAVCLPGPTPAALACTSMDKHTRTSSICRLPAAPFTHLSALSSHLSSLLPSFSSPPSTLASPLAYHPTPPTALADLHRESGSGAARQNERKRQRREADLELGVVARGREGQVGARPVVVEDVLAVAVRL
jgi:hypothetical protein